MSKKINYQPYKSFLVDGHTDALRLFGVIGKKETPTPEQALRFTAMMSEQSGRRFTQDIGDWVCMTELRYLRSERYTIFPESEVKKAH